MPDVFASSSDIVTDAFTTLVTSYLGFWLILVGVAFGFYFARKIFRKAKGGINGKA